MPPSDRAMRGAAELAMRLDAFYQTTFDAARAAERSLQWEEAARLWTKIGRHADAEVCETLQASRSFWDAWRAAGSPEDVRSWAQALDGTHRRAALRLGIVIADRRRIGGGT